MSTPPPLFTIHVRQQTFTLTHSQLTFDSPNFFATAFLSHDFSEATSKELRTDRNPQSFEILVDYMSGYDIFPLEDTLRDIEENEGRTRKLRKVLEQDAEYFGFERLSDRLKEDRKKRREESLVPSAAVEKLGLVPHTEVIDYASYLKLPDPVAFRGLVSLRNVTIRVSIAYSKNENDRGEISWWSKGALQTTIEHGLPTETSYASSSFPGVTTDPLSFGSGYGARTSMTLNGVVTTAASFTNHHGLANPQSSYRSDHTTYCGEFERIEGPSTENAVYRPSEMIALLVKLNYSDVKETLKNVKYTSKCEKSTELFAHEIYFSLVDVNPESSTADATQSDSPRKELQVQFLRASTFFHLHSSLFSSLESVREGLK